MKNLFNRSISIFAIVLSLGFVVACGGNSETETDMNNEETETMTTEADTATAPVEKLNINTASAEEFRTIPNVGDQMVREFEEYRPYTSIQQFRQEIGKYVDEAQVAEYEKYIYVPIHRNDSDAQTLMQIPGLDQSEADELVAGRPYETNQAFLDALSSMVNKDQLATAESYLKAE